MKEILTSNVAIPVSSHTLPQDTSFNNLIISVEGFERKIETGK